MIAHQVVLKTCLGWPILSSGYEWFLRMILNRFFMSHTYHPPSSYMVLLYYMIIAIPYSGPTMNLSCQILLLHTYIHMYSWIFFLSLLECHYIIVPACSVMGLENSYFSSIRLTYWLFLEATVAASLFSPIL